MIQGRTCHKAGCNQIGVALPRSKQHKASDFYLPPCYGCRAATSNRQFDASLLTTDVGQIDVVECVTASPALKQNEAVAILLGAPTHRHPDSITVNYCLLYIVVLAEDVPISQWFTSQSDDVSYVYQADLLRFVSTLLYDIIPVFQM